MSRAGSLLWVLGLTCVCGPARSNDSAVVGVGGTIEPMREHSSVRMVRERVDVKLYPDRASVRCEFVFKNEGRAATVKMGFPESAWGDVRMPQKSQFHRFRSYVDGKPVHTTYLRPQRRNESSYRGWYLKNVSFRTGQTRIVVDEYSSGLGEVSDGSTFFSYVLRTGKSWKGSIGEAVVTVDVSKLGNRYKIDWPSRPRGCTRRGPKLVWTLRNFEPSEDILVGFRKASPRSSPAAGRGTTNAVRIRPTPARAVRGR